jgi:hypothetical protein
LTWIFVRFFLALRVKNRIDSASLNLRNAQVVLRRALAVADQARSSLSSNQSHISATTSVR